MANIRDCDPCLTLNKNKIATTTCPECDELLCVGCSDHHRSLKATRDHHLVDINVSSQEKISSLLFDLKCEDHNLQDFQYFCVQHDLLCCKDCIADKHRTCEKILSIDSASKNAKNSKVFQDCGDYIQHMHKSFLNLSTAIEKTGENVRSDCQSVRKRISVLKSKAVQRLTEYEQQLLWELEKTENEILPNLHSSSHEVSRNQREMADCLEFFQFIKENGTNKQSFLIGRQLQTQVNSSKQHLESMLSNAKEYSITLKENPDLFSSLQQFGEINCSLSTQHLEIHLPETVTAQVVAQKGEDKITENFHLSLIKWFYAWSTGVVNIAITDNDIVVYTQYNIFGSCKLLLYTIQGKYIGSVDIKTEPVGLAIVPQTETAVVSISKRSENCLQFCNTKSMKVDKMLSFSYPIEGVAISNDKIYLGAEKRIVIVNFEGVLLESIAVPEESISSINVYNESIFYKYEKKICRQTPGENPVTIYESENIRSASNFVIDKNGSIFVTMRNAKTLLRILITSDGSVTHDVLGPCLETKPYYLWFNSACTKLVTCDSIADIAIYECV